MHRLGYEAEAQALYSFCEPRFTRRKAPAHEPLALRPECRAGRETEPRSAHELLAERQAIGHPRDAEERVHRSARQRDLDARNRVQLAHQEVARAAEALARAADHRLALRDGEHAGALHEHRRARSVELD